jgi:alanine racemase
MRSRDSGREELAALSSLPEPCVPTSRLEVDLASIDRNLAIVRSVTSPEPTTQRSEKGVGSTTKTGAQVGVCAVLKQDGYGCGAARIGKRLAASGADSIAVYSLDEARAIADAVPTIPILVLMPVHGVERTDPLYRHAAAGRLHLTLHGHDQLTGISEMAARIGATIPLHLQIDTGLARGGCHIEAARPLLEKVIQSQKIRLGGIMTHFTAPCCDDQATREQARMFRDFVQSVAPMLKAAVEQGAKGAQKADQIALHAANSCATFRSRAYHGTMVRVGQALLGFGAEDVCEHQPYEFMAKMRSLESAVRWTSSVVHLQEVAPGWGVGYASAWRAPLRSDGRMTKIALVPVGYADGYPRSLGGRGSGGPGYVGFTGRAFERRGAAETEDAGRALSDDGSALPTVYAPVVGRVSMDQITVDVTDVPEQYLRFTKSGNETVGPEVELYSRSRVAPNFVVKMAEAAGSITHELLCRIGPRVERVYRYPASEAAAMNTNVTSASARADAASRALAVAMR